ncbi:hypothetical protein M5K25_028002 [Dendrobium thyrsiflorum]|uniref:Uncharacterized protein n=1 Tax=Dendrobium thyrsiflorum TaxID=117978 RepID=A0ABD0TV96_DENTH
MKYPTMKNITPSAVVRRILSDGKFAGGGGDGGCPIEETSLRLENIPRNEKAPPSSPIKTTRATTHTCWKLFTVFPILRPISGSFFGPKTSAATPAMTTSSGTPSPNRQRQSSPRELWPPPVLLRRATRPRFAGGAKALPPLLMKTELEEASEAELIVKLSGSELRTQRHQNRLNPSPNESRSRPRSAVRMFKTQFGLPNGLQILQSYSRIERLDETNPTSPRSQKSDICRSRNCSSNHPRSRGSISAVRTPESQSLKRSRERSKTALAPCSSSTTAGTSPDHRHKALYFAGPPLEGPTVRRTTT